MSEVLDSKVIGAKRGHHVAIMVNTNKAHETAPLGVAVYGEDGKLMAYCELDLMLAAEFAESFCAKLVEAAKAAREQEEMLSKKAH